MTTVHPAAIAGATLIAIEPALEFHGVNMPTTPYVGRVSRAEGLAVYGGVSAGRQGSPAKSFW